MGKTKRHQALRRSPSFPNPEQWSEADVIAVINHGRRIARLMLDAFQPDAHNDYHAAGQAFLATPTDITASIVAKIWTLAIAKEPSEALAKSYIRGALTLIEKGDRLVDLPLQSSTH
jgi:hypothetical protein